MKKLQIQLNDLSIISKKKIILEPDQILVGKLLDFEQLVSDQAKLTDEEFENIESVLIQCLQANKSQMSFQCSIRIAECLLCLYQGNRQMKIWNLVTVFNKKPEDPIIFATGHVLNKRGKYAKSVVPGVCKTLLALQEKHVFSQLFTLCACFKAAPKDMEQYVDKCFNIIKKNILTPNEPVQLLCLKLCIKMVNNGQIMADRLIPLITQLLTDQVMPYIIDQSCYLVAKLAYSQFKFSPTSESESKDKQDDGNLDWQIRSKKVSPQVYCAFNMMENFKKNFGDILPRFLSLLDPEFIHSNRHDFFALIRRIDSAELKGLVSLLGIDVRREFFQKILKEKITSEQINILMLLAFDTNSLSEVAALAFQLATHANSKDRTNTAAFFTDFVKKDPETTSLFLKKATKYLAKPPIAVSAETSSKKESSKKESSSKKDSSSSKDSSSKKPSSKESSSSSSCSSSVKKDASPKKSSESLDKNNDNLNLVQDMRGMALIVSSILTLAPNRKQLIELVEDNIVTFLRESWKSDSITAPSFQPSFTILTALPKRYVMQDEVDRLLSLYPRYLLTYNFSNMNEAEGKTAVEMAQTLTLFLSVHSNFESTIPIIDCILSKDILRNSFTLLCIYLTFPKLIERTDDEELAKIAMKIRPVIMKGKPTQEFITAIVKNPFITRTLFLKNTEYEIPNLPRFFTEVHTYEIAQRTFTTFPDFFVTLPKEVIPSWIKWIVVDCANLPMAHCLIYSLINDKRTQQFLPANLHEVVLSVISTFDRTDHLQMAAEVVAVWSKIFPKIIPQILENATALQNKAECFILASLFAQNVQLTDDMISTQILELNNLAKTNSDLTPYALFALSSLFLFHSGQLASIPFTESQANFILSLLCTHNSLDPFVLFYISHSFNTLLPIISPDVEESRPFVVPVMKMIIQLISNTPLPFCKQIFYHTMHSVFSFIRQYSDLIKMSFPVSRGVNLSCKIEACQAFADMLVVKNLEQDFMNLIPQILLLLQRTNHNNANMFVIAVAANFAKSTTDLTLPNNREQIAQWTQLIKLCVSAGNLPATGIVKIGANDKVKLCMLKVSQEILPLILKTDPLLNESLDDIMTSLTRAVESRNPQLQKIAYPLLQKIIVDFGEMKGENGQPIIMLYDIMFASALKIGFYNLDFSGEFVISFLNLHVKSDNNGSLNIINYDEFLSILDYFITGFRECDHKTWHYHAISSKLCTIAIQNKEIYEKMKEFWERFAKDYSSIIFKAGELWNEDPPNQIEITKFKVSYYSIFSDILKSFVFIQSKTINKTEYIIKPRQLLTFLFNELLNEESDIVENSWRINAAFRCLGATLDFYPSEIFTKKIITKAIDAASQCYDRYDNMIRISNSLPLFMRPASRMIELLNDNEDNDSNISKNKKAKKNKTANNNKESWKKLVTILVDDNFDPTVLCFLIKNGGNETISQYSINFLELIWENYKKDKCELDKAIALCVMIFYVAEDKLEDLLDFVLSIKINYKGKGNRKAAEKNVELENTNRKNKAISFKFSFLQEIFKFFSVNNIVSKKRFVSKFFEKISRLIWNNFEINYSLKTIFQNNDNDNNIKFGSGKELLVQIISEFPKSSFTERLLLGEDSLSYSVSSLSDLDAVSSYFEIIKFVLMKFENFQNNDEYINASIKYCLRVIIQWGDIITESEKQLSKNDNTKENLETKKAVLIKGKNSVFQACQIMKMISVHSSPLIRISFKEMDTEFQKDAINYVKIFTKKTKTNKKGANILLFGGSKRTSKMKRGNADDGDDDDDGWQDLTEE